ncbi:MAG: hydrogenase maturation nickel metallochaperone HypA [Bacteroidota bacterium]
MHEVGIAQNILEIIENEVKNNSASTVNRVKLIIGEFTGIVKEALEFALDIIKKNTVAHDAKFEIETIKLKTFCQECDKTFIGQNESYFLCPNCGKTLDIVEGKEMRIDFIDVE